MPTPKTPTELLDERAKQLEAELKLIEAEEKVEDAQRKINAKRKWYHKSMQRVMGAGRMTKNAALHPGTLKVAGVGAAGVAGYTAMRYGAEPIAETAKAIVNAPGAPLLTTVLPSAIVAKGAYDLSRHFGAGKPLSYAAAAAAGGATAAAESFVAVPVATGVAGYYGVKKAIDWSGLDRSKYADMEKPGVKNYIKRNVVSTPGKVGMGFFYSGWNRELYKDLTWQERIGAAPIQAVRGTWQSLYTPWDKLQGAEKVPGFFIRPVVSALRTVWDRIPGTGAFDSPDAFGKGVANLALSPISAAKWLLKAPGRFWKYANEVPPEKK